jgi:PAS domain-containing protein
MADDLATRIGGQGQVLMLGMTNLANMQAGFRGFQYRMSAYSNVEVFDPEDDMDIGPDRAQQIVADYLKRFPNLAGIAGFDANSGPGAAAAVKAAGKQDTVRIVSVDTDPLHQGYLKSGIIDSLFAQKREIFTSLAFQMLYTYNHGSGSTGHRPGAINIPGNIDTGFVIVTRENIDNLDLEFDLNESLEYHRLSQSLVVVSGMVENNSEPALATDLHRRIVYANPAARKTWRIPENRWGEFVLDEIMNLDKGQIASLDQCLRDETPINMEVIVNDKSI